MAIGIAQVLWRTLSLRQMLLEVASPLIWHLLLQSAQEIRASMPYRSRDLEIACIIFPRAQCWFNAPLLGKRRRLEEIVNKRLTSSFPESFGRPMVDAGNILGKLGRVRRNVFVQRGWNIAVPNAA